MLITRNNFTIRKLVASDAISLFKNYKGDDNCAKYISSNPHSDIKQTHELINRCLCNYQLRKPTSLVFAIAEPSFHEVIGLLVFVFNNKYAEIHYGLSNRFSGRGIATEVCFEGINWLKSCGVKEVRTQPHFDHHASLRVLDKCGFKHHGLLSDFAKFSQLGDSMQNCADMRIQL